MRWRVLQLLGGFLIDALCLLENLGLFCLFGRKVLFELANAGRDRGGNSWALVAEGGTKMRLGWKDVFCLGLERTDIIAYRSYNVESGTQVTFLVLMYANDAGDLSQVEARDRGFTRERFDLSPWCLLARTSSRILPKSSFSFL